MLCIISIWFMCASFRALSLEQVPWKNMKIDHFSMPTPIVQVSYFMLARYSFDELMNLTFLFSIPKCEYLFLLLWTYWDPMIQGGHLAKPRWEHILNLGQHIDLTKQDVLLPMNLHEAWITNELSKLVM